MHCASRAAPASGRAASTSATIWRASPRASTTTFACSGAARRPSAWTSLSALFSAVVANLVNNAQEHGGGARLVVECGDELTVHVLDDGPGIPEDERDKVFRPFYRLDASRDRATGGSGLGLAIVHQLCQAHGWRVTLGRNAGRGTDASVRVPLY